MQENTTYSCKVRDNLVIENGILYGAKEPYVSKHNNYGEYVLDRMRAFPEFVGQVDGLTEKEETFAMMTEKSVKCAMWLREQNIKPGDVIAICSHNHMDVYVPCLASLYIGAIFNPWWSVNKEMAKYFLTMTRPKMLFADEASARIAVEVAKEIDVHLKVLVFGSLPGLQSLDDILASQDIKTVSDFRCTQLSSLDSPATILCTSGTGGLPKSALYSHRTLFGNVEHFKAMDKVEGTTISMTFSSLGWITGVLFLLRGVVAPDTRIVPPEFSIEICCKLIEKFKVNWMLVVSNHITMMQNLQATSNYDLSSLKYLFTGGSVLKEAVHKAMSVGMPQSTIMQVYGSTEMGGVAVRQSSEHIKLGSSGSVVRNIMMKVVDVETGVVLGPNQTGEACFKSPFMMTGYYNNPEETNKVIDAEGWMSTGDIVYYDEEGDVFITDRVKEMFKYNGQQVSPAMIEQVLLEHPEVCEAAVVGLPHDLDGARPIAYVSKMPNAQVTKEDLQKLVMDKLPDYMNLRGGVEFLKELPHTMSGKISRGQLRKMAQSVKAC